MAVPKRMAQWKPIPNDPAGWWHFDYMDCEKCRETCFSPLKCWQCPSFGRPGSLHKIIGCFCQKDKPDLRGEGQGSASSGCGSAGGGWYDVKLREETQKKDGCVLRCDGLKRGDPPHQTETQREFFVRRGRCIDNCSQYITQ